MIKKKKSTTKICVERGFVNLIAKRFNVSVWWVSKCLNGHSNSPFARVIRHIAITEYKGKEISITNKN